MARGTAVALLLLGGVAGAQSLDTVVASESRQLVEDFEELAKWCIKKKLLKSRNQLYEAILHFDPDHTTARKWLRYTRENGKWVRKRAYREPRNFQREWEDEFRRRRAEITSGFCNHLLDLIDDDTSAGPRQRALAAILVADPNHELARTRNGEVKSGGRWLLRETLTARKRHMEVARAARKSLAAVPPPRLTTTGTDERQLGTKWVSVLRGERWRGLAVTPHRELTKAVRAADAAQPLIAKVFGVEGSTLGGTFYSLKSYAEYTRLLARHSSFTADRRAYARRLGGTWIPRTRDFISWSRRPETRLDSICRMACSIHLSDSIGRTKQGWIVEGVGLYFTYRLIGTRYTILVRRSEYAEKREDWSQKADLWRRIHYPGADWIALARELTEKGKGPDLVFLVSKGLNQMTVEDLVHSYALAAYLIEGRPKEATAFLQACCEGVPIDEAIGKHLDTTLPGLEARLIRWVRERRRR